MKRGWLRRLIVILAVLGLILYVGVHFELLKVTGNGIEILREGDLNTEQLIRRADLYFKFFQYEDALRIYCMALFKLKPGHKELYVEYKPTPGEVDLENIPGYDLEELAKKVPGVPGALLNIAICYTKLGRVKEAMMVYKGFRQVFPDNPLMPVVERNMEDLRLNRL